jgi:hypothetical protein
MHQYYPYFTDEEMVTAGSIVQDWNSSTRGLRQKNHKYRNNLDYM